MFNYNYMARDRAEELAAKLNADPGDDWTYTVEGNEVRGYIVAFDENGEEIGAI